MRIVQFIRAMINDNVESEDVSPMMISKLRGGLAFITAKIVDS